MFSLSEAVALLCLGAVLFMSGAFLGAWISFKFKNTVPGERFLGGVPKGEVFTMKDEIDSLEEDSGKGILERTEKFLKALGGNANVEKLF